MSIMNTAYILDANNKYWSLSTFGYSLNMKVIMFGLNAHNKDLTDQVSAATNRTDCER